MTFSISPFARHGLAVAIVGAALGLAGAAGARTEFRGGGYVTDFANCEATGWSGMEPVRIRFSPAGLTGNDPANDSLTILLNSGVVNVFGPLSAGGNELVLMNGANILGGPIRRRMPASRSSSLPNS